MIIGKYNTDELTFVGFWDNTLFRRSDSEQGYVFIDKENNNVYISYADIKKAKRGSLRGKKNVNV